MRISDWSSDVCSSDLRPHGFPDRRRAASRSPACRTASARRTEAIRACSWPSATMRSILQRSRRLVSSDPAFGQTGRGGPPAFRSEEHTSELQSLMRISYAVFCVKKKNTTDKDNKTHLTHTDK